MDLSPAIPSFSSASTYGPGQFKIASMPAKTSNGVQKKAARPEREIPSQGRVPPATKRSPPSFPCFLTLKAPARPRKGLTAHITANNSLSRERPPKAVLRATKKNNHKRVTNPRTVPIAPSRSGSSRTIRVTLALLQLNRSPRLQLRPSRLQCSRQCYPA